MFRSETEFVEWLQALVAPARGRESVRSRRLEKGVRLGIGDDAALVAFTREHELILTTDMSIEDVHFTRHLHPPEAVGHRALARSLRRGSDGWRPALRVGISSCFETIRP